MHYHSLRTRLFCSNFRNEFRDTALPPCRLLFLVRTGMYALLKGKTRHVRDSKWSCVFTQSQPLDPLRSGRRTSGYKQQNLMSELHGSSISQTLHGCPFIVAPVSAQWTANSRWVHTHVRQILNISRRINMQRCKLRLHICGANGARYWRV